MVEAERTEELKVANLSTSDYGVALWRTKAPPLQPFIVAESSLYRERIKKTDMPSGAELQSQRKLT